MVNKASIRIVVFALFFSVLAGMGVSLAAAQPGGSSVSQDVPITITSDTMTYEPDKDRVIFKGNVQAIREEFHMWSAQLTLYLKPSSRPAQPDPAPVEEDAEGLEEAPAPRLEPNLNPGDLDRIVADGNVRFKYNNQTGTAEKATYTMATATLVLSGNPVLKDGENSITGNVVKYYLNENRSEVESGGNQRVQAVFGTNAGQGSR